LNTEHTSNGSENVPGDSEFVLRARGITKEFPGVRALTNVDFDVRKGEIVALLGENGAGKSTLIKIFSGVYSLDVGTMELFGKSVKFSLPSEAKEAGIGVIHQELNYVATVSVAENIYMGDIPRKGLFVDYKELYRGAKEIMGRIGLELDPRIKIGACSVAQKQLVEIAKLLSNDIKILIMDEPTSALNDVEIENIFRFMKQASEKGISIIYISHKLEEIFQIAHRVVVLRDGYVTGEVNVKDATKDMLISMMVGREIKELYPKIQVRYSQTSHDKGLILEQDPRPGSIVKAGRRIRLVVSKGLIISKVDNYIGRNINEVRMDIQTLASGMSQAPLTLKEPLMYVFSSQPAGTILEQQPEPGRDISGPLQLEFVVSKGRDDVTISVPKFTGLSISAALELIGQKGINFSFSMRPAQDREKAETVVSQEPPANTSISTDSIVSLTVTPPQRLANNEVFRIFKHTIPANPYPLAVRLEALYPTGERVRIINVEYSGGEFTVPCKVPAGTVLILSMLNREIYRETVRSVADFLSTEQL